MAFDASLELFSLTWVLLCITAGAVVIDSLLKAAPQSPRPGAQHPARVMIWASPARPGAEDRRGRDSVAATRDDRSPSSRAAHVV